MDRDSRGFEEDAAEGEDDAGCVAGLDNVGGGVGGIGGGRDSEGDAQGLGPGVAEVEIHEAEVGGG